MWIVIGIASIWVIVKRKKKEKIKNNGQTALIFNLLILRILFT